MPGGFTALRRCLCLSSFVSGLQQPRSGGCRLASTVLTTFRFRSCGADHLLHNAGMKERSAKSPSTASKPCFRAGRTFRCLFVAPVMRKMLLPTSVALCSRKRSLRDFNVMEVREYEPYVVAQATVTGPMRKSMSGGFMKVARLAPPCRYLPSQTPQSAQEISAQKIHIYVHMHVS